MLPFCLILRQFRKQNQYDNNNRYFYVYEHLDHIDEPSKHCGSLPMTASSGKI